MHFPLTRFVDPVDETASFTLPDRALQRSIDRLIVNQVIGVQGEVEKESGEDECDKGSSDCQLCESQVFWEMPAVVSDRAKAATFVASDARMMSGTVVNRTGGAAAD